MREFEFEIKVILASGKVKRPFPVWSGTDALNAATRYAEAHPGETVVATRPVQTGIYVGIPAKIIQTPEEYADANKAKAKECEENIE